MNKKILILVITIIFIGCSNSKPAETVGIENSKDSFQVIIGEEFINKFLGKIGKIDGESRIKGKKFLNLIKIDENVKWSFYNLKMEINRDGAYLNGDADIELNGEKIDTKFRAKAEFEYDNKNEKLLITADEIRVKKLWDINLSGFYSPKFDLKISNPLNKKMQIKNSDGTIREIELETSAKIECEDGAVKIVMDLN